MRAASFSNGIPFFLFISFSEREKIDQSIQFDVFVCVLSQDNRKGLHCVISSVGGHVAFWVIEYDKFQCHVTVHLHFTELSSGENIKYC